jgi:hypothetical protein
MPGGEGFQSVLTGFRLISNEERRMGSTGKIFTGPVSELTGPYPSTLSGRLSEAISLGAVALASFIPDPTAEDADGGIAVGIERRGKALRYGSLLYGCVRVLMHKAAAEDEASAAMSERRVERSLQSALEFVAKENKTASDRLTDSLQFLASAIGRWFERGAENSDFEEPLLNAVACAAAAVGQLADDESPSGRAVT